MDKSNLNPSNLIEEGTINIREIIEKYFFHWKWFLIIPAIVLSLVYLKLRYTEPIFSSKASILIKDSKKGGGISEMAVFEDLGIMGGSSNLKNEIEILKSRKLLGKVVDTLGLQQNIVVRGSKTGFRAKEIFSFSPIKMNHVIHDSLISYENIQYKVRVEGNNSFIISLANGTSIGTYNFGEKFNTSMGEMKINKTSFFSEEYLNRDFEFTFLEKDRAISSLLGRLKINTINKETSVLAISTTGHLIDRNNAIINQLIEQYEHDQLEDKNLITKKTRTFIKDRIEYISKELSAIDQSNLDFKKENKLIDISSDAQILLNKANEIEKDIIKTNIQLELTSYMKDFASDNIDHTSLLPTNLGIDDHSISTMIGSYNQLILDKKKLLYNSSELNPSVIQIDNQLKEIKSSLNTSLSNIVSASEMKLKVLNKKAAQYSTKLSSVPGYEKKYRDIYRQQQIKETLYLYLLQKREENEIAFSANVGHSKVIDNAYCNGVPIGPKKKIYYLVAIIIGLIIPFAIIYVRDLLDNKVHSQKELEKFNLPHLANIPLSTENEKLVAQNNPRSILSEAFRILRTNVAFLFPELKDRGNTIFVTSTIAGEGKTFVSLNVAHSLALTGKKVIVVGLDLRAPKLLQYLELQTNLKGVSNYIINPDLSVKELAISIPGTENLFLLPSGTTPPNPSELLLKPRFKELFDTLKNEYDYIIADTAPVSLVTDTLTIANFADATLYVTRANKLDKRMLEFPAKLYAEKKLNNMSVIVAFHVEQL